MYFFVFVYMPAHLTSLPAITKMCDYPTNAATIYVLRLPYPPSSNNRYMQKSSSMVYLHISGYSGVHFLFDNFFGTALIEGQIMWIFYRQTNAEAAASSWGVSAARMIPSTQVQPLKGQGHGI
jgi:hypothetical protein